MGSGKAVEKSGFGKRAQALAGAALMAVSIAGMAVFYNKEDKVSEGYREIAEAVVSASAISDSPGETPGDTEDIPGLFDGGERTPGGLGGQPGRKENAEIPRGKENGALDNQEWEISYDWNKLLSVNQDTLGWLCLPGSLIDFPVAGASDNGFYLSHDFTGKESSAGCLFMDKDTGMEDFNRVVYGHNMGTGSEAMFSTLLLFKEEEYFGQNPVFYFTECFGQTEIYEIMAVVEYDVKDVGEWDFRTRAHGNMEDYNRWFEQLEGRALYYREPERAPERILTLSTCDRSRFGRDGRLLVIASGKGGGYG